MGRVPEKEAMNEREEMSALTLRLPKEQHEALKLVAALTGVKTTDLIRKAVANYLADEGRRSEFAHLLNSARSRYRVALDKLADL